MYVQVGDRHNRKRRSASREYHAKFANILLIIPLFTDTCVDTRENLGYIRFNIYWVLFIQPT